MDVVQNENESAHVGTNRPFVKNVGRDDQSRKAVRLMERFKLERSVLNRSSSQLLDPTKIKPSLTPQGFS